MTITSEPVRSRRRTRPVIPTPARRPPPRYQRPPTRLRPASGTAGPGTPTRRVVGEARPPWSGRSRAVAPTSGALAWIERNCAVVLVLAAAVLAFSGGWRYGDLVFDGPGVAMYVRLALDHWSGLGVPYWLPDMWAGAPVWAFAPSFPVLFVAPLGAVLGPEGAVKAVSLLAQVVGGWGAWTLARSLWGRGSAALLAGFVYALHPLFASHVFFGHETSVWVMAATPWLVWSLRLALRGKGIRYVVGAGLIAAFAVLQQPEHVYGLAILCGALLVVELARARTTGTGPTGWGGVLVRAGVVVAVGLGAVAHWLVPFASLSREFVLTPPEAVRSVLVDGVAADVGREMGVFLDRADGVSGTIGFVGRDFLPGTLYLSWVGFGLTLVTVALLSRRDRDGCLTAVLFASAVGVWMSTAGVSLADSGPVERGQLVPFVVVGAVAGLLVGSFLRRLRLPTALASVGGLLTAGLLLLLPYATPFVTLQRIVPFMASIRFPRLYPIAMLGIALGTAYPLTLVKDWAMRRQPRAASLLAAAAALAVAGLFVADIWPYRSYYEVRRPPRDDAYATAEEQLAAFGGNGRVATQSFGDPEPVDRLLEGGRQVTSGWPHALASKSVWRVTGEAFLAPRPLGDAALGLSGTTHVAGEAIAFAQPDVAVTSEVELRLNERALPLARAYDEAVVLGDEELAPMLATVLAQRNVGVVDGTALTAQQLGDAAFALLDGSDACGSRPEAALPPGVAGQVATVCSLDRWVGVFAGVGGRSVEDRPGAVFTSTMPGLRGISVWLDRPPEDLELVLYELDGEGGEPGREILRARSSGLDERGLYEFAWDPLPGSGGVAYGFELLCGDCGAVAPRMAVTGTERAPANLIADRTRIPGRVAAFTLDYDGIPPVPPSSTSVRAFRPGEGRWELTTSGSKASLLVVAEAWFPGWKGWVDGEEVPVRKADGAFLGVVLPPGDHEVRLAYQLPRAAVVGRGITLVTLVASGLLLWAPRVLRRRRDRRRAGHELDVGPEPSGPRR